MTTPPLLATTATPAPAPDGEPPPGDATGFLPEAIIVAAALILAAVLNTGRTEVYLRRRK